MNNINTNHLSPSFKAGTSSNRVDELRQNPSLNKNEAYDEYAYFIEDDEEEPGDDTYTKESQ